MEELKIDAERVRKAADTCPDAKRVLRELFPEAFKEFVRFPYFSVCDDKGNRLLEMRIGGRYAGQVLLGARESLDWKIEEDGSYLVLVARYK